MTHFFSPFLPFIPLFLGFKRQVSEVCSPKRSVYFTTHFLWNLHQVHSLFSFLMTWGSPCLGALYIQESSSLSWRCLPRYRMFTGMKSLGGKYPITNILESEPYPHTPTRSRKKEPPTGHKRLQIPFVEISMSMYDNEYNICFTILGLHKKTVICGGARYRRTMRVCGSRIF